MSTSRSHKITFRLFLFVCNNVKVVYTQTEFKYTNLSPGMKITKKWISLHCQHYHCCFLPHCHHWQTTAKRNDWFHTGALWWCFYRADVFTTIGWNSCLSYYSRTK